MKNYLCFFLVIFLTTGILACGSSQNAVSDLMEPIQVNVDTLEIFQPHELDEEAQVDGGYQALLEQIEYPAALRRDHIEGEVVIELIVLKTGQTANIKVIKSDHEALESLALKTAKSVQYLPGVKDGQKVNSIMQVPMGFYLF